MEAVGIQRWELAHEQDRDDRDKAERNNHVSCSRAVRDRSHLACTVPTYGEPQREQRKGIPDGP